MMFGVAAGQAVAAATGSMAVCCAPDRLHQSKFTAVDCAVDVAMLRAAGAGKLTVQSGNGCGPTPLRKSSCAFESTARTYPSQVFVKKPLCTRISPAAIVVFENPTPVPAEASFDRSSKTAARLLRRLPGL